MSATLIPEADPELVSKLEKTGETDKLEDILEETEISREYDLGYRNNSQKTCFLR